MIDLIDILGYNLQSLTFNQCFYLYRGGEKEEVKSRGKKFDHPHYNYIIIIKVFF